MIKLNAIGREWNALKTDKQRWEAIRLYSKTLMVILDNDATYAEWTPEALKKAGFDDRDDAPSLHPFDGYIGWNDCAIDLLNVIGIKCEV